MRERLGLFIRQNAVGLIALFVALGGVAYAAAPKNSVTSKSIKNANVRSADLAANAVTPDKVADQSLTGAEVADQSLTGAEVSALSGADIDYGVHVVFASSGGGSSDTASASCPAGEVPLGGGGGPSVAATPGALVVSKPIGPLAAPTGWQVKYESPTTLGIGVYAVCMPD